MIKCLDLWNLPIACDAFFFTCVVQISIVRTNRARHLFTQPSSPVSTVLLTNCWKAVLTSPLLMTRATPLYTRLSELEVKNWYRWVGLLTAFCTFCYNPGELWWQNRQFSKLKLKIFSLATVKSANKPSNPSGWCLSPISVVRSD